MNTQCLTYEQIINYTENRLPVSDHQKTYEHLTSCELCSNAVNGFTETGFSINDIVAIDQIIDERSNVNSLTFSKISIVVLSLISITGFYFFSNSISVKNERESEKIADSKKSYSSSIGSVEILIPISKKESTTSSKNNAPNTSRKRFDIPEKLPTIAISSINLSGSTQQNEISSNINNEGYYIHNFKVANYSELYFKKNNETTFPGYPSSMENKYAKEEQREAENSNQLSLKDILEQGLLALQNEDYTGVIQSLSILIEKNPEDENALFYTGVAFYHLNAFQKATSYFEKVNMSSVTFHEEAEWHLAICHLKTGNNIKAIELLSKIVSEKEFYAGKAKMILEGIK